MDKHKLEDDKLMLGDRQRRKPWRPHHAPSSRVRAKGLPRELPQRDAEAARCRSRTAEPHTLSIDPGRSLDSTDDYSSADSLSLMIATKHSRCRKTHVTSA